MICPEKWQKQIEDLMKQYGIAGLAVAVTDREKTVWHHGFGVTSVEKPWDPVTTETLFRIASGGGDPMYASWDEAGHLYSEMIKPYLTKGELKYGAGDS